MWLLKTIIVKNKAGDKHFKAVCSCYVFVSLEYIQRTHILSSKHKTNKPSIEKNLFYTSYVHCRVLRNDRRSKLDDFLTHLFVKAML